MTTPWFVETFREICGKSKDAFYICFKNRILWDGNKFCKAFQKTCPHPSALQAHKIGCRKLWSKSPKSSLGRTWANQSSYESFNEYGLTTISMFDRSLLKVRNVNARWYNVLLSICLININKAYILH